MLEVLWVTHCELTEKINISLLLLYVMRFQPSPIPERFDVVLPNGEIAAV